MPDKEELKQVEEYRVVAVGFGGDGDLTSPSMPRAAAEAEARDQRRRDRHARIQRRTVTTTPWETIADA